MMPYIELLIDVSVGWIPKWDHSINNNEKKNIAKYAIQV